MSILKPGELSGIRDPGLLESAVMSGQHKAFYQPSCDVFDIAAAYCGAL